MKLRWMLLSTSAEVGDGFHFELACVVASKDMAFKKKESEN